jgi:hypothetical protein
VIEKGKEFAECKRPQKFKCDDCGIMICMGCSDIGGDEDHPKNICSSDKNCKAKKTSVCKCSIF